MSEPTPLKIFNGRLLAFLPRPEWSHSNGNRDSQVEPQYGSSATKISHNSTRAKPLNSNYALVYFSPDRIVIRNHGLEKKLVNQIQVACTASARPEQEVVVL